MDTISKEQLDWLIAELEKIKISLHDHPELALGIGNLINRFNIEILGQNSTKSTEQKFFQMVDDIATIWNNERGNNKFTYTNELLYGLLKKVSNLDIQTDYTNDLSTKLSAANSPNYVLSNARNTLFASPKSSVVNPTNPEQKQGPTPVGRRNG
jgi:hypothetical protein